LGSLYQTDLLISSQLKKLYLSFNTVAGWDETAKMISLPTSVWQKLAKNKSAAGRNGNLSQWQTRALTLYHNLVFLIEGNTANGDLMITTVDSPPETQHNVGNDVNLSPIDEETNVDLGNEEDDDDHQSPVAPKLTPSVPSKRKQGSAFSPNGILDELNHLPGHAGPHSTSDFHSIGSTPMGSHASN
jgi:hypothetical protein